MDTLPLYLAYLGTCVGLLVAFTVVYTAITPYREFSLIRDGNKAASISLGGTLIGFGVALASTASHSIGVLDLAIWGTIALACQIGVFFVATLLLPGLRQGIEADRNSYGITLAAMAITMGLINAGAVSY